MGRYTCTCDKCGCTFETDNASGTSICSSCVQIEVDYEEKLKKIDRKYSNLRWEIDQKIKDDYNID